MLSRTNANMSSTIFLLVLCCLVHYSESAIKDNRQKFEAIKFDILPGNVLSVNTIGVTQNTIKVPDKKDCVVSCTDVPWCRSVNAKITPESDGLYLCEIMSTDKYTHNKNLKQDFNYIHFSMKNPCEKKPCPNYTVCIVHYNRRDYVCQCEDRYFGDQCQFECFGGQALGMENRKIPDSAITASSAWAGKDHGYHARLNNNPQHWAPSISMPGEWLQVDFGNTTVVTKIATQGRPILPAFYTTSYSLTYRRENESWKTYVHASHGETLPGNTNHDGTVTNTLVPMIVTRYIRVYPKTWNPVIVMRVEFYGCYYPQ